MTDTWEAFDARQKEIIDLGATLSSGCASC